MADVIEVMVEAIEKAGTPFIVGIPGNESLEIIEATRKRGMRFILVKQEFSGAMMVATWGELTGSPGACIGTHSSGAVNMMLGVTHAFMDRCPLIAITDQWSAQTYETRTRNRMDQIELYRPITKWNTTLNAQAVHQQVRRGIRTATAYPPGPIHFDMPADQRMRSVTDDNSLPPLELVAIRPDKDSLKPALDILRSAKKPVIIAGLGVPVSKASAQLVAFAERIGAAVMTTGKCKGSMPDDHPLLAGCFYGGMWERKLVNQADLIVAVGFDPIELMPGPWPYAAPVLSLGNVDAIDAIIPAATEIVGDLHGVLDGLSKWATEGTNWGERVARSFRREIREAVSIPGKGLSPQTIVEVARAIMPLDTIATCDTGAARLFASDTWTTYRPREFLVSNGLATMGFSIPGAMAARMLHPDRPILALCGDGSFMMAVAELQTSVRENLPVIILVFDDGELGVMAARQDIKGFARYGTQIGGQDWERLAAGFGANGIVVETEKALGDALTAAMKSDRTTVIAARLNSRNYVDLWKVMKGPPS